KKHEVTRAGKVIPLTLKEYRLLFALLSHQGEALTRRQLLDDAWGPEFQEKNNELNVHMNYLRAKIDSKRKIPFIQTIRGVGFTLKG
ncbi:MAG: winged helix-turn-helix domain-containing protein, partial [Candidatus Pacebacteria bacterium]|nr:winged helix-turn-helix domain-containing protein [Candidatus Paceibacterota bacterium]